MKTMGSTTLNREDLDRGAEPDNCYYIQNQPLVAGRRVNLATDPPPDLIVEVDITRTESTKIGSMPVWVCWSFGASMAKPGEFINFKIKAMWNAIAPLHLRSWRKPISIDF